MRITRIALVAALAVAAGTTTAAAAAQPGAPAAVRAADSAGTTSSTARLADGSRVDSAAAAEKVRSYWTVERMRRAIPVSDAPDRGATRWAAARPTGKPGSTPAARGRASTVAAVTESAAVGKVFFHNPSGGDFVCSASTLNSSSKQLVITAGHCVHQGNGGTWMQNWTFVPRYRNGTRPFGTFAAKQFRTFDAWINSGDKRRDVAMVTTWPLNGQRVVNVVGGHGLNWNWPRNVAVTILGYPSNHGGGELQWWCQGTTRGLSDGRIEIQCDLGPGYSGSPWLRNYNDGTGIGDVDGVGSTTTNTGGWNRSSYFDDAVKGMFDAQGSVT